MNPNIRRYCKSCIICQKTVSKGRGEASVRLCKTPLIDVPFKRIGIDLIGPIKPKSAGGHQYVLTIMDYAVRYIEAIPIKGYTAKEIAEALVSVFSRVGIPDEILTDQGRQFTANYMQELMEILKIRHLMSSPYHPMCNELVESFNGTLKRMLFKLCNEHPTEWYKMRDPLLFAYREVPNESTGFSPFELMYGRHVRGPMQILKELWTGNIEQEEVKSTY